MTLATLREVLQPALADGYAVAGLVCLGWEDMRAYAHAAEAEGLPVILQAGPGCLAHTPLPVLGQMMRTLAESVSVPVVVHLDHGSSLDECRAALDSGFTSLMYDGSRAPLTQNVDETARVVELAHAAGMSCEGEIGFVGYAQGEHSRGTDPREAERFARETGIDAMAVSVGNLHLQQGSDSHLDEVLIRRIEAATDVPLVIHGGSGVPVAQRTALARGSRICKFNVGTELRREFGTALRATLDTDPELFDRVQILGQVEKPIRVAAQRVIRSIGPPSRSEGAKN